MTHALLINPHDMTVTSVSLEKGRYAYLDSMKALMDIPDGLIDIVTLDHSSKGDVTMIVDDEGLYVPDQKFFTFAGLKQPFAGKALLTGTNHEGETVSLPSVITPDLVKSRIRWLGSADSLEHNIQLGFIDRPRTAIGGFGKPMETVWEWTPDQTRK
jgi:hypothetical protein